MAASRARAANIRSPLTVRRPGELAPSARRDNTAGTDRLPPGLVGGAHLR